MSDLISQTLRCIQEDDWDQVRLNLHPYLHWTRLDGGHIRGRKNVLAMLKDDPVTARPSSSELRDNQIYRWTE